MVQEQVSIPVSNVLDMLDRQIRLSRTERAIVLIDLIDQNVRQVPRQVVDAIVQQEDNALQLFAEFRRTIEE